MSHRRISGLREVHLAESPWKGKGPRAGAKGRGLRFERTVAKFLPQALHGQWFKFLDNNGPGYCSPDILFQGPEGELFLVECKLTDWALADKQMEELYLPILKRLFFGEIRQIVVAKYLTPWTERSRVVGSWEEALLHPAPVFHAFQKRDLQAPKGISFPRLASSWSLWAPPTEATQASCGLEMVVEG